MNQKVTLEKDGKREEIVVGTAYLDQTNARFESMDPFTVPDYMHDDIEFFSKDLTGIIRYNSDIEIISVSPTDEEVDLPEPTF